MTTKISAHLALDILLDSKLVDLSSGELCYVPSPNAAPCVRSKIDSAPKMVACWVKVMQCDLSTDDAEQIMSAAWIRNLDIEAGKVEIARRAAATR